MKERNNFSRIAFIYDFLASVIFGESIRQSQIHRFKEIERNSYVLILGGGTGWILEELDKLKIPLKIKYVEISEGMLKRAKSKNFKNLEVDFLHSREIPFDHKFDRVMAFYFLDVFNEDNLKPNIDKIYQCLKPAGYLHFADFEVSKGPDRIWQVPISMIMHLFFKLTAHLEANRLLDLNHEILQAGFAIKSENFYYRNFICSRVYSKVNLLR